MVRVKNQGGYACSESAQSANPNTGRSIALGRPVTWPQCYTGYSDTFRAGDRALHPQANQLTSGPVAICGKYTGLAPGRLILAETDQANGLPHDPLSRNRDRTRAASRRPTAHSHPRRVGVRVRAGEAVRPVDCRRVPDSGQIAEPIWLGCAGQVCRGCCGSADDAYRGGTSGHAPQRASLNSGLCNQMVVLGCRASLALVL